MKKVKRFNVGDKVFAKVKGYPAWPAIITEAHNTKYNVKFYGTGETGSVKPKDLFYYLKHKTSFVKSLKRKDYKEAIEEIESAIQECGTDGNNEEDAASDTMISSNTSANNSIASNIDSSKTSKRKRSSSVSSEKLNETQAKKKVTPRSSTPASNASSTVEDYESKEDSTPQTNQSDTEISSSDVDSSGKKGKTKPLIHDDKKDDAASNASKKLHNRRESQTVAVDEEFNKENDRVTIKSENSDDTFTLTADDVKIITDDYLRALVTYAEHVRKNEQIYKNKPIEKRNFLKNEVVIVKLPEGKYIGIKYNRDDPPTMNNEYEYAEYEACEAKTILSLKAVVENGTCKPEDDPHLFVTNLNIDEVQLNEAVEIDLIERKRAKLKWLRIESNLIELDAKIKGCLGLDKAEPKAALQHLYTMLELEIDPLMLKKHPHVVDMIKRLRRYIGNVKEWNMSDVECDQFETDAENVRDLADDVFMKFASLFKIEDDVVFWEVFGAEVQDFKEQVKDMQESAVFALSSEPNSRQKFLDGIDEEEEMKIIIAKMEKTVNTVIKPEKENFNKVANTDNNHDSDVAMIEDSNPTS